MRVVLAAMPWQSLHRPSLPVGLLHSVVRRDCPDVTVGEYHGGIDWAAYLLDASAGRLGPREYSEVAENGVVHGLGDWVFAGCLYGDPAWRAKELREYAADRGLDISSVEGMREYASDFLDKAVDHILAAEPEVVGLTSTFMQNVPSLALARRLKSRRPDLTLVMGGANCDGPMGHALHRNHRFLDFVVRGEGEPVFPALLNRLMSGDDVTDLPGLCWWAGDESMANPQATHGMPPGRIPSPDFDVWQQNLESSPVREYVSPELVIEGSRGCWWGEKHQCTFCGLNGSLIAFRARPADRFFDELSALVERHQILDVVTVDNILDMGYFTTLLPRLAATGWDLRIHYEIKSNLRADQIQALADAGIVMVQPGIESLSGRVLTLMDKGVDGTSNVRMLRDSESNGLTVAWNYLYGFPGEMDADYTSIIAQVPALVHLQPPTGAARIVLERFSPYFERPELGFARRDAAAFYHHVYDLPDEELADLVYFFDCEDRGIAGETEDALRSALDRWRRDHSRSSLIATDDGDEIIIDDRRLGWPSRSHRFDGWRAVAYWLLESRRTVQALRSHLADHGHHVESEELDGWLREMSRDGLVFVDGTWWLALATRSAVEVGV